MELIINKFGAKVGKHGERIYVYDPVARVQKEYPVRRVSRIVIARPASLTSGAVQLAIKYDIDIVYLEKFGMPYGRIYSSKPGGLVLIKRKQLEKSSGNDATYLAKQFIFGKIKNQINYLYFLKKTIPSFQFPEKRLFDILRLLNLVKGPIRYTRD